MDECWNCWAPSIHEETASTRFQQWNQSREDKWGRESHGRLSHWSNRETNLSSSASAAIQWYSTDHLWLTVFLSHICINLLPFVSTWHFDANKISLQLFKNISLNFSNCTVTTWALFPASFYSHVCPFSIFVSLSKYRLLGWNYVSLKKPISVKAARWLILLLSREPVQSVCTFSHCQLSCCFLISYFD